MKAFKVILKISAALAIAAGALLLAAAYWDKLTAVFDHSRGELKEKAVSFKEKLPTKQDMIRINPFRKAEIDAEYADYADVK